MIVEKKKEVANGCFHNKKLKPKQEEFYGIQGIYTMPMCPKCNEPTYSEEKCPFCGQELEV